MIEGLSFITITDMLKSTSRVLFDRGIPIYKEGTELQFDFVDSKGQSIYTEAVSDYLELLEPSVEIYDDTAAGIGLW